LFGTLYYQSGKGRLVVGYDADEEKLQVRNPKGKILERTVKSVLKAIEEYSGEGGEAKDDKKPKTPREPKVVGGKDDKKPSKGKAVLIHKNVRTVSDFSRKDRRQLGEEFEATLKANKKLNKGKDRIQEDDFYAPISVNNKVYRILGVNFTKGKLRLMNVADGQTCQVKTEKVYPLVR
jgi:hypothetical protein